MTFLSPWLLLALIPVAALAVAYVLVQRRRRRYAVRFATLPMLDRLVPRKPGWRRHLPGALVLLALVSLGMAAARPQADIRVPYERATVIVAIDSSGSMLADDVKPSRLAAAKEAAAEFVEQLPDTFNVGAIEFAGSASVIARPTTDHREVADTIRAIDGGGGGTAIGESVFQALDEVTRLSDRAQQEDGRGSGGAGASRGSTGREERIPARLVLLSDGANTSGRDPGAAADAARQADMPVSTIAYGTQDGVTRINGMTARVPVDESTLRGLASGTDGRFYEARSSDELRQVYQDIGSSIGWRVEPVDLTPWLALLGLGVAVGAGALSLRWFGRIV